jgi:hypothetical protein
MHQVARTHEAHGKNGDAAKEDIPLVLILFLTELVHNVTRPHVHEHHTDA